MKAFKTLLRLVVTFFFAAYPLACSQAQSAADSTAPFAGLWEAKRQFGPDLRGPLIVRQINSEWTAEIAGKTAPAKLSGNEIRISFPTGDGFVGKFDEGRTKIVGHWKQQANVEGGPWASPLVLVKDHDGWRGNVTPIENSFTMYLMVKPQSNGSYAAFLKNPERNAGWQQIRVAQIETNGSVVSLFAAGKDSQKGRLLAEGRYDRESEMLSIFFPSRGGTYDFHRVHADEASDFYPRGWPTVPYKYSPPIALDDGWPTASLEDVGISRDAIEKFMQMLVNMSIDSVNTPEIHGVLITRHGKLVLEEYFHGENRDKAHDTRSAAKSFTATLIGAAINAGVQLKPSSPVYQVMNGGVFPDGLEPRKRALTLEHLLTMSSGLDCDDSDDKSPGREDYVTDESGAKDYYQYTMALKMIREPGEKAVYCSIQPNLAGGVLQRAAGKSLPVLFDELLAGPLQIKEYFLPLTPTDDAYMGGGVRLALRDFAKFGQLYLNHGTWNGRRVVSAQWTEQATKPRYKMGTQQYGYLWWILDYPYKGRTVRAFYAGGNGGQMSMAIPELDLVIATMGGNYADRVMYQFQQELIPKYILPAIDDRK